MTELPSAIRVDQCGVWIQPNRGDVALLPQRCMVCGKAEGAEKVTISLSYWPKWLLLSAVLGILPFVLLVFY